MIGPMATITKRSHMNSTISMPTITLGSNRTEPRDFKKLDQLTELAREELEQRRAGSKDTIPTVQMSIRMDEEDYLRFRALRKAERRTNGDMVQHLMTAYLTGKHCRDTE